MFQVPSSEFIGPLFFTTEAGEETEDGGGKPIHLGVPQPLPHPSIGMSSVLPPRIAVVRSRIHGANLTGNAFNGFTNHLEVSVNRVLNQR